VVNLEHKAAFVMPAFGRKSKTAEIDRCDYETLLPGGSGIRTGKYTKEKAELRFLA
jgi:hypothetical protein